MASPACKRHCCNRFIHYLLTLALLATTAAPYAVFWPSVPCCLPHHIADSLCRACYYQADLFGFGPYILAMLHHLVPARPCTISILPPGIKPHVKAMKYAASGHIQLCMTATSCPDVSSKQAWDTSMGLKAWCDAGQGTIILCTSVGSQTSSILMQVLKGCPEQKLLLCRNI